MNLIRLGKVRSPVHHSVVSPLDYAMKSGTHVVERASFLSYSESAGKFAKKWILTSREKMSDHALIRCPINWLVIDQFFGHLIGVWSDPDQADKAFSKGSETIFHLLYYFHCKQRNKKETRIKKTNSFANYVSKKISEENLFNFRI